MFTAASCMTAQTWKQSKYPPTNEWITKMKNVCFGILFMFKKYRNSAQATTCMNFEDVMLSEVNLS
jgi:hypothetical protein